MKKQPFRIIIAEDDQDDKLLLLDALEENDILAKDLIFVENGEELMVALNTQPKQRSIILLDLNMPKMDGREALCALKKNPQHKHIPVIVFTTSSSEEDIRLTYENGGTTFFTKPTLFSELVDIIGVIKKYWIEKAALVG